jgi:hypothetical protein
LHPIAATFSSLAIIFLLIERALSMKDSLTFGYSICSPLALVFAFIAWIIDLVLFNIVRHSIKHRGPVGSTAKYGNAIWMTLGAVVSLLVAYVMMRLRTRFDYGDAATEGSTWRQVRFHRYHGENLYGCIWRQVRFHRYRGENLYVEYVKDQM